MSLHELLNAAIQLPANERGQLVHELLRSFDDSEDTDVDASWVAEIETRAERALQGETRGKPLDELIDTLEAKLKR